MLADRRSKILIVEDDPGILVLQRRRLERAGFVVEVAGSVDAALAALAAEHIAVVVLDYRLGETTGLDLHRRMKASGIELPVILVSGAMEDAAIVEALRAGVRDIVVKTADYLEYLPDAVRGVLGQAATAGVTHGQPPSTCVLVVEDDRGTAMLEARQLERAGYRVKVVSSAPEALDAIRSGGVGLAVIDLRLPGEISGLALYEQWKAEGFAVPGILVTGFADQAVAIKALRLGIRDLVPKSGDFLDDLPAVVDRVLVQVRLERKLAESELRLASIIGTTMDAILMCDSDGRIALFNRSAEDMFECSVADALGKPVTMLIPALTLDAAPREPVRERRELEGLRVRQGGVVPIEVSVTEVQIHDQRLFTVIARDITERRLAEEELREADRRKDEFLGMLAHELRNPLAAIMNAGEVLHRTVDENRAQKLIGVVRRQTRALSRMVDDLLDVSRVTLGKIQLVREPLLLGQVVSRAVEGIRATAANAGVELSVHVDSEPQWLFGDTTRLEQVVTNLLTNAIKFTPSGGRIDVAAASDGGHAVLIVRDTGVGMPAALVHRVFDLFVQGDTSLDRSRSGLGIGLALVRKIVTLHGGTVMAASAGPGQGSEFTLRLPIVHQEQHPLAESPDAEVLPRAGLSVVVVDDQPDVADSVAMLIEALGHRVRAVYEAAAALTISHEEPPDVMVVDIGMPGMTGYELAECVRRDPDLSHVYLIALTGYGRDDDRSRVMQAGFDRHITKPVTDTELHAALSSLPA